MTSPGVLAKDMKEPDRDRNNRQYQKAAAANAQQDEGQAWREGH